MSFEIPDHYSRSFTTNVELLLQQQDSRLTPYVTMASYTGEAAQVVKQFGEVEFQEKTTRLADTNFSEIDHKQRWIFPADYDLALPIEKEDEIRMLNSPQSAYVQAMSAAWMRKKDAIISDAFYASAKTGKNGSTSTPHDTTNQRIARDYVESGSPAASGLTIGKLRRAKKIADSSYWPMTERYIAVTAQQMQDLLRTTEVTSSDYNTVKALVDGSINSFLGWKFTQYEGLPTDTANTDRRIPCWHKSAIVLGQWNALETKIGERPDKKYLTQVFMKGSLGATRTQEKKVIEILCDE